MKRIAAAIMLTAVACGDQSPPAANSGTPQNTANSCDRTFECGYDDEIVVESCDESAPCVEREYCGETILCQQIPHCLEIPRCSSLEIEVESCDGLENCDEYMDDFCGWSLYCTDREIVGRSFDQSCSKPSDCWAIHEGDPCECKSCPDAAISTSARELFDSVASKAMCDEACPLEACEVDLVTACVSNTCVVREAQRVAADDFERSCDVDEDCAAVYEGEICAECQCPNAAINITELEAYLAQFDTMCVPNDQCPCVGATATCVDSVCRGPEGG